MQRKVVDRCRTRSDAEGHLQVLRRLMPEAQLVVVFDCDVDETRSQHSIPVSQPSTKTKSALFWRALYSLSRC
ncbi:MAG: hypothetical protein KME25_16080 [Symplocastrum torsivum CPER-KK1]|uniref:Uncharacterized protein n=1 Tax=Symplocastrum torsivum CPER-KK1 TaxID=450513 RepID=A0A951PL62_9CYAN|nr:hypothetical protein [Symplocastrum torsivum CPER-KK1]